MPAPAKMPLEPCHVNPNEALSGERILLVPGAIVPSIAVIGVETTTPSSA